jgi:glutaredoxin 3
MATDITIFTTNQCASCKTVKKWLSMKGHEYSEVNVEEYPERREEAIKLSGAQTVPVTVVTKHDGSRQVITGPNFGLLAPALA